MPTIRDLRKDADAYREVLRRKGAGRMTEAFEEGLAAYETWSGLEQELGDLRAESKKTAKEFGRLKAAAAKGEDAGSVDELEARGKDLKTQIASKEEASREAAASLKDIEIRLPGWLAEGVPDGNDESAATPLEYRGALKVKADDAEAVRAAHPNAEVTALDHEPFAHYGLVGRYVDQEKAGEVAQSRFYYELDELVILDLALSMYAVEFFRGRGFEKLMVTPYMLRKAVEAEICYIEAFEDTIFEVPDPDAEGTAGNMVLLPSSEHSIVAYYLDTLFKEEELPKRVLAWSPCFRREAGSHGKQTLGIFRVKQFHKVEIHSIVTEENAEAELDKMRVDVQDFLDTLGLANRSVVVAAGDMDKRSTKQIDVETWMPAGGAFFETHSIATLGPWVSEKAKIRVKRSKENGGKNVPVHNLYATAVAVQRMICCLAEQHYDPAKKAIVLPECLHKYTMGVTEIEVG